MRPHLCLSTAILVAWNLALKQVTREAIPARPAFASIEVAAHVTSSLSGAQGASARRVTPVKSACGTPVGSACGSSRNARSASGTPARQGSAQPTPQVRTRSPTSNQSQPQPPSYVSQLFTRSIFSCYRACFLARKQSHRKTDSKHGLLLPQ